MLGLGLGAYIRSASGLISFSASIFSKYRERVIAAGGVVENDACTIVFLNNIGEDTYNTASLIMYPSGYEAGTIFDLKPTDGSGDLTFTRASTATRVNEQGLIEGVRTNLLLQSNTFNTTWTTNVTTLTSGQSGYNGSSDAWLLEANSTGTSRYVVQNVSLSGVNTFSCYAKAGTTDYVRIQITAGSTSFAYFDLSNGVSGSTLNEISVKIESVGSGWYRCSLVANDSSISSVRIYVAQTDSVNVSAGDNIYIQDAQLELSPSATEYIPTTTTAVSVGMLANVPRIDYTGGGCGKLLLEPQRTNLVLQSQEISVSPWSKGTGTILSNVQVSPDGTSNADKYVYGGSGTSVLQQTFTVASGSTYTATVWLKGDSNGYVIIGNSAGSVYQAKSVTTEWQRFEYQRTTTTTTESFTIYLNGSTLSSVSVWGFQYELGSYSTSYIPTTTTAVTRVADAAFKTGISSMIGQTEGVLYWEGETTKINDDLIYFNRSIVNTVAILKNATNGIIGKIRYGSSDISITSSAFVGNVKIAIAYKTGDTALFVNGVKIATNTTPFAFTGALADLTVMNSPYFQGQEAKKVQSAMIFKTRLSDDNLTLLTGTLGETYFESYALMANYLNYTIQ